MKSLRNLAVVFVLVFAAIGIHPAVVQGSDCYWSESQGLNGTWFGVYSCTWGCDYTYEYSGGGWSQTGQYGDGCDNPPPV